MLSFSNDYSEGACPEILQRLTEENLNPSPGYGTDRHCAAAAEKIKAACGCPGAVVFAHRPIPAHFVTRVKQHGALLAKGFLLGLQFDTLFTDNLYYKLGEHANAAALELRQGLAGLGLPLYIDSPTNQQFVELPDTILEKLKKRGVSYGFWEKRSPDKTVVRFATSWSTPPENVKKLLVVLQEVL